jgi:hypothetical protein
MRRDEFAAVRRTPVTRASALKKDAHATISCGIDLTDYAAICVANGINQAYEIANQSSVKITFQPKKFSNRSRSALSDGRYNLKHFVTALPGLFAHNALNGFNTDVAGCVV